MAEEKNDLPPGWVARQSKTYPDRVYYFNIDSGLSSWEFPDILEYYKNDKVASSINLVNASTPAVLQSTQKLLDKSETSNVSKIETNNKRNMLNPSHNHLFRDKSSTSGTRNDTNSLNAEPLEKHRPKIWKPSRNHPYCSDSLRKSSKKSPSKQSENISSASQSKPDSTKIDTFAKKLDTSSKTAKSEEKNGSNSPESKKTRQGSHSTSSSQAYKHVKSDPKHTSNSNKNVVKINNSLIDKLKHGRGAVNVDSKHESPKSKMKKPNREITDASTKDPNSSVAKRIIKQTEVKSSNVNELKGEKYSMKRKSDNDRQFGSASKIKTRRTPNTNLVNTESNAEFKPFSISKVNSNIAAKLKSAENRSKTESSELNFSKHKQKFACNTGKSKRCNLHVNSTMKALVAELKEPKKNVVEEKKDIRHKTEETLSDLRKVVRSMQQNIEANRDVSLKDSKLPNLKQRNKSVSESNVTNPIYIENNDLTVHTRLKLEPEITEKGEPVEPAIVISDEVDEEHKTTEYKVFIGDKNKLLNIQSWINDIDEGSATHSPAYDDQLNLINVNESSDSGYISPPMKRGWPGKLKKSDITSRDMVDMDIEECLLPAPGQDVVTIEENEVEDMDIDLVLVEVRKEVKNDGKRDLSTPIDFSHPHDDVGFVEKTVLVVLDTNVIISNLSLLQNLKNYALPGNIKPSLYIPWVVLCELDRLKMNKHKPLVVELAQKGIHFLKDMFKKKHPRIKGQTPKQSDEAAVTFQSACNDDKILQACLQCRQKYEAVVLFSNDNNLAVKSFVVNIPAYNCKDIYFGLRETAQNLSKSTVQSGVVKDQTASHTNTPVLGAQTGSIPDPIPSFQNVIQPKTPVAASQTGSSFQNDFSSVQTDLLSSTPGIDSRTGSISKHSLHTGLQPITSDTGTPTVSTPNQNFMPIQTGTQPCKAITSVNSPIRPFALSPRLSSLPNKPNNEYTQCHVPVLDTLPVRKTEPKPSLANKILQEEKTHNEDMLIDDMFSKMKDLLKDALEKVLQNEMQSIYGEIWLQIVHKKPPWSLNDILVNLQKHWRAVFNFVFNRNFLEHVDHLVTSTAKVKMNRMCDLSLMVQVSCDLLEKVKNLKKYGPKVLVVYNTVVAMRDLCSSVQKGEMTVSSIHSLDQYLNKKLNSTTSQNEPQTSVQSCTKKYFVITAEDLKPRVKKSRNSTEMSDKSSQQILKTDNLTMTESCPVPLTNSCVVTLEMPSDNQSCVLQSNSQPGVLQSDNQPCVLQSDYPPCNQSGPSNNNNQGDASNSESQEMIAGERLSNIWKFIYQYCEQFHKAILLNEPSPEIQKEVTPMLKMLVPIALELRKYFVGLLELSVESLKDFEQEFTSLSDICNNFFTHLNVQDDTSSGTITPLQLLILYSKPEHRSTLSRCHNQLDEMMNLMYQCLHKLCPDD